MKPLTLREAGMCSRCGTRPVAEGFTQCEACRDYLATYFAAYTASGEHAAAQRRRYAERRAEGLCARCPDPAAPGRGGFCRHHADEHNARLARSKARARAATVAAHLEHTDIGGCYLCEEPIGEGDGWHVEHVAPLSRGGREDYTLVAHDACNLAKHDRFPGEYLQHLHDAGDPRGVDVAGLLASGVFRVVVIDPDADEAGGSEAAA